MAEDRQGGLIEKFDTGELSQDIIPPNFTDPDVLFEVLKKIILTDHPGDDLVYVTKAYELAKKAHKDQKRKSGEPYLIHPVCVAIILAQIDMDTETIVGGLLHDVVEDTKYTVEDITKLFSEEIALLVDGVTKLTQLSYNTPAHSEPFFFHWHCLYETIVLSDSLVKSIGKRNLMMIDIIRYKSYSHRCLTN